MNVEDHADRAASGIAAAIGEPARARMLYCLVDGRARTSTELAMVRGVMTQHVMEAVSREMFGGDQGRKVIETTLPQIQASTSMAPDQKRLLVDIIGSLRRT